MHLENFLTIRRGNVRDITFHFSRNYHLPRIQSGACTYLDKGKIRLNNNRGAGVKPYSLSSFQPGMIQLMNIHSLPFIVVYKAFSK